MNNSVELSVYGIGNIEEVIYNPSYEFLFTEERRARVKKFETYQDTEEGQQLVAAGPPLE